MATRMAGRRAVDVKPRKTPLQARAGETTAVILEAAARILADEGAAAFTTNHVAAKAGVSVGSLYQYYPNKEAILFALQEKEIAATTAELQAMLMDDRVAPRRRLEAVILRFLQSESAEARMRCLLESAGIRVEQAAAIAAAREAMAGAIGDFLGKWSRRQLADPGFEVRAVITLVASAAQAVTREPVGEEDLRRWAVILGDMLAGRFAIEE